MQGTSGLQQKPVKYRVYKSVNGIPFHAQETGLYETRKVTEICMLRRLPKDHVEEIDDTIAEESLLQENPSPPPPERAISEMGWHELRLLAQDKGVFKVGMARAEVEIALTALDEPADEGILHRIGKALGISVG